jgi:hypothetical protein
MTLDGYRIQQKAFSPDRRRISVIPSKHERRSIEPACYGKKE